MCPPTASFSNIACISHSNTHMTLIKYGLLGYKCELREFKMLQV